MHHRIVRAISAVALMLGLLASTSLAFAESAAMVPGGKVISGWTATPTVNSSGTVTVTQSVTPTTTR
jgi:hypothetical protein